VRSRSPADRHETATDLADKLGSGHRHAVEEQRGPPVRTPAEVVKPGPGDALVIQVDVEGADPAGARPARTGEHQAGVRIQAQGDGGLLSGEQPAVAILDGLELQGRSVGAVTRLGDGQARDRGALGDAGKPAGLLLRGAVAHEHVADQSGDDDDVGGIEIGSGDLLGGDAGQQCVRALAAELAGDAQTGQAHACQCGDEVGPHPARFVVALVVGARFLVTNRRSSCR